MNKEQPKQKAWPFQERVCNSVLAGNNMIVQAPTGSGKTRAALEPFAQNLRASDGNDDKLPLTCRYAVPLRALANQFYAEYKDLARRIDRAGLSELERRYQHQGLQFVREQTGEVPEDPKFEAGLTFCTIDQLLAAFLGLPYGTGRRQTNLKVAGVFGSYLVLDEWHLYPLRALTGQQSSIYGARTTTLAMLDLLGQQGLGRFVLMTATFSTSLLEGLKELLGANLESLRQGTNGDKSAVDAFREEYQEIAGDRSRMVCRRTRTLEDSVAEILAKHYEHQDSTLVVCNTVERAQQLYLRLREASTWLGAEKPRFLLLHSRLTVEDRRAQAQAVEEALGADAWKARVRGERDAPNLIVVGTQVIEVGLNISAITMHTEIGPANSLVQRAGRCARFAGQHGDVFIYPLADDEPAAYLPYPASLCRETYRALPGQPERFDFAREQELIDTVHTPEDATFLHQYQRKRSEIQNAILAGWQTQSGLGAAAHLIRDVRQIPVLIHDNPERAIREEPWRWQAFGLHPDSLVGRWEKRLKALAIERECDWSAKEMVISSERGNVETDSRAPLQCDWQPISDAKTLHQALMVALPTKLAQYDQQLGFVLLDPDRLPDVMLPPVGEPAWESKKLPPSRHGAYVAFGSEIKSYREHISGLVSAYDGGLASELAWAAARLERALSLPAGSIDAAARIALACHDIGKLTKKWQKWAHAWQELVAENDASKRLPQPGELLAKTDFDGRRNSRHRELQKRLTVKRPNHAVESAALGTTVITAAIAQIASTGEQKRLLKAVRTAIARHHTTHAEGNQAAALAAGAPIAVRDAFGRASKDQSWVINLPMLEEGDCIEENMLGGSSFTEMRLGGKDQAEMWTYFLIVRALRLADQRADGVLA